MSSKIKDKIEKSHKTFITHSWEYEDFHYDWMEGSDFIVVWNRAGWKADELAISESKDDINQKTIISYIYDWATDKPDEDEEE